MTYGYVRVSSLTQHVDRQIDALRQFDPSISTESETLFVDKVSGKSTGESRMEYRVLRRILRPGDELVVDALDRLGRTKEIIRDELAYFRTKKVTLRVLNIPTTLVKFEESNSAVLDLINSLIIELYSYQAQAEMEERERRVRAGIESAKARGVYRGRKPIAYDKELFGLLFKEWKAGNLRSHSFMEKMGMQKSTFYRRLREFEESESFKETT